ncbi:MAG TPA: type I restriction enzyme HsdR N-terminal domain-containing protein [Holophagaceae bacterium]|nr:type I restriction enzyme HsdR N-terminal domain-containing protein [Holophagaceae bacterium]
MANVPKRVQDRLRDGLKKFLPIVANARSRDIGEADTVIIVTDVLSAVFGYDKYSEITSEYAIRGTYCDLAIKLDGALQTLIEVKAIGIELKDSHVKQAVDYAANQGVDWVVLTNGVIWRVYKVTFAKPIDHELVVEFDFLSMSPKTQAHIDLLYLCCKEGWSKSVLGEYQSYRQALSRFFVAAVLVSDPVLEVVRRELRRVTPDVRVELDEIRSVMTAEVFKREVFEGDKALEAKKRISKAAGKALKLPSKGNGKAPLEEVNAQEVSPSSEVPGS